MRIRDLTIPAEFSMLKVIGPEFRVDSLWRCVAQCDCGQYKVVDVHNAAKGKIHSCGCLYKSSRSEIRKTHGKCRTAEYKVWAGVKRRCYNQNEEGYYKYGGRGIKVCERWLNSFENFLADMGTRPSPQHSIERKDNEKDYSPDNCKWATLIEQANNTRNNRFLEFKGIRLTVTQWARKLGVTDKTLFTRIYRGHNIETILREFV